VILNGFWGIKDVIVGLFGELGENSKTIIQ